MSMAIKLNTGLVFQRLHELRLAHALAEAGWEVVVPPGESAKFKPLMKRFGVHFSEDPLNSVDISRNVTVSHDDDEPLTTIGRISKPLVFPQVITAYCRSLWKPRRDVRFSFQGLLTEKRRALFNKWIKSNLPDAGPLRDRGTILRRLRRRALSTIYPNATTKSVHGELLLWSSDRGRRFPIKSWDEEYFCVLSSSQFVLCPSGESVWSYRFFESVLCGAIPIVETRCVAYDGFRYVSVDEPAGNLEWSRGDAEFNYRTCLDRITVPIEVLSSEIVSILEGAARQS
jgi:hypothetical protein